MKLVINTRICYKIIAFITLFLYLYPISVNFLPLDTDRILFLLAILYIIIKKKCFIKKKIIYVFIYCFFSIILAWSTTTIINNVFDFSFIKKIVAIIIYCFSSILVVDLIKKAVKSYSEYTIIEWIVYVAIAQAIISLLMFFIPSIESIFLDIIKLEESTQEAMNALSTFRLIAFCKFQYANIAVMYGFATISLIILWFSKKSVFSYNRFLLSISLTLFIVAGVLSARTYLLVFGMAFVLLCYLLWEKLKWKALLNIAVIITFIICIFFLCLKLLENSEYTKTYEWAFEWYINLTENDKLETVSTNKWKNMYIFPTYIKTWLIGDGMFYTDAGAFYMNTDIGYLRNLFYWGGIGLLLMLITQYKYFKEVYTSTNNVILKKLCIVFILWTFLYNFKEFWYADIYWALLLIAFLEVKQDKYQSDITFHS